MREEVILTERQKEVVKLIAESEEGAKVSVVAKKLGEIIQKVNGAIRGLKTKGIIEADEDGLYWLCDGVEIKDGQGKSAVFVDNPQGAGKGIIVRGGGEEYSNTEEYIRFKGLEGIDELKRSELDIWLQTYNIGRNARNVAVRQYETNPGVRYVRKGLYDSLRRAGVKEEFAVGIVEQVFLIEDQNAPYLNQMERNILMQRKTPFGGVQPQQEHYFEEDTFRESSYMGRQGARGADIGMERKGFWTEKSPNNGRTIRETIREVLQEELSALRENPHKDSPGVKRQHEGVGYNPPTQDVEVVEEPIIDEKGIPRTDKKGNVLYRKRYIPVDKSDVVDKEWRQRYDELKDNFGDLEKRFGDSKMQSEIDFLKGQVDTLEKHPHGDLAPEVQVEVDKITQSSQLLGKTIDNLTSIVKAHMGVPDEEGVKRVALTDEELEDLERRRREKEG